MTVEFFYFCFFVFVLFFVLFCFVVVFLFFFVFFCFVFFGGVVCFFTLFAGNNQNSCSKLGNIFVMQAVDHKQSI